MDLQMADGSLPNRRLAGGATVLRAPVTGTWRWPRVPAPVGGSGRRLLRWLLAPVRLGVSVLCLDIIALIAGSGLLLAALPAHSGAGSPALVAIGALTLWAGHARGAYRQPVLFRCGAQWRAILPGGVVALAFALLLSPGLAEAASPALAAPLAMLALGRAGLAALLRQTIGAAAARRTLVIGEKFAVARLIEALELWREPSLSVSRILRMEGVEATGPAFEALARGEIDQVVVAATAGTAAWTAPLLRRLADWPVDVFIATGLSGADPAITGVTRLGGATLLQISDRPIRGWRLCVKTSLDLALAVAALAVTAVPMGLIAAAIRLESPGPALFRQRRTGLGGQEFFVLKFRTMYDDAADHAVQRQVAAGDPRVTRVGAVLRRTSLDELPQILNVLRGEMSLVGPRPQVSSTLAGRRRFDQVAARYDARHRVKPGLTGLAQVRGWRGRTDTEEKLISRLESDLEYIETWSLSLDLQILLRTAYAVLRMRNAV